MIDEFGIRSLRITRGRHSALPVRAAMVAALLLMLLALLSGRALAEETPSIIYNAHVQSEGWQGWLKDGKTAGTTGKARAIEAIKIKLRGVEGGVAYSAHVQGTGWQRERTTGKGAGTTGKGKAMEAIKIRLTGEVAKTYDVEYRAHVSAVGWLSWVKNGEVAGTTGQAKRIEAIEIKLVKRFDVSTLPGTINCSSHVQGYGWLSWQADGNISGIVGEAKRVEAVRMAVNTKGLGVKGGVRYRVYEQGGGWQGWVEDGHVAGSTGKGLRVEAIEVQLTGQLAHDYDVWYCTHVQQAGWLGWAVNGAPSGSIDRGLRIEALKLQLVPKGGQRPGAAVGFLYSQVEGTPIMGASKASMAQITQHCKAYVQYPGILEKRGAASVEEFVRLLFEEARAEGVRADVVYAQVMKETNYLSFGGSVLPSQCNFAGIGVTSGNASGFSFPDVRTGLRAQVQHLKAYASDKPLWNPCVDPRFTLVTRGIAPTVEELCARWDVDAGYADEVVAIINEVDAMG